MDPAEALADSNRQQPDTTPAAQVAAWLTHPAETQVRPPSPAELLTAEIERGDCWNQQGIWLGQGPELPKEPTQ